MTYQKEQLTFPRATSRSRRTQDKWGPDKKIYDNDWANWPSAASQDPDVLFHVIMNQVTADAEFPPL